jgi:alanyl-tRNA synthetase
MQAHILRKKFLDFFKSKKHQIVDSDSLVPKDDPTILFTPAGMNQFKKEFLGFDSGFKRIATCQRCLRTDDLDKVGHTPGHHTFFEMLGNFSFGDYFKPEAISLAWEFLTEELRIKKERLWVSVYENDDEAYKIWKDLIKIPPEKIIKLGDKQNFWPSEAKEKGPNGPCGPCSEIFFDQGSNIGCKKPDCNPSCDCGRFVEVWNLVFTQFNRKQGGILEPLPKKNIDTGMGLERLAAVVQGAPNNFETDLFQPIIKEIAENMPRSPNLKSPDIYAVSDHLRAIAFAVYDGVLPSNEGRGYVVRKLIRKSMLHLQSLGIEKSFLYKLVPVLAQIMKGPYPELETRQENISEIILAEEKNTLSIWNSSDILLTEKFKGFDRNSDPVKAGKIAFQLYDTYGMPLELTQDWLNKHGISISKEAFNKELSEQKNRSKSQSAMKGEVFAVKDSDYGVKESKFLGYKKHSVKAKILKIIKGNKDEVIIILDKTPFYPESGGQVGDTGEIVKGKNIFEVLDTKRTDKVILHIGRVKSGSFKAQDDVVAKIDAERRLSIARNHTATHILQAALRKVLGTHVQQQGSLVAADRFRFDFTHFKGLSKEEISRVEEVANNFIAARHAVNCKEMALEEAKKSGALAFFAEKYAENVRVVSIGDISKELCGGTHLDNISQIRLIKIISEGSVASGIRRIEGVTAGFAEQFIKDEEQRAIEESKKRDRLKELRAQEKKLNLQRFDMLKTSIDEDIKKKEVINGIDFITHIDTDANLVRKAVDLVKEKIKKKGVIFSTTGSNLANQVFIAIGITQDLIDKGIDASKLIKEIAQVIGGSGSGRKDFAQAGGNRPENYEKAIQDLKDMLSKPL